VEVIFVAKRLPGLVEIYKGIRKSVAPPTRAQRDRRDDLKREVARREMEKHKGYRGSGDAGGSEREDD